MSEQGFSYEELQDEIEDLNVANQKLRSQVELAKAWLEAYDKYVTGISNHPVADARAAFRASLEGK